jgi:hypothetical protein
MDAIHGKSKLTPIIAWLANLRVKMVAAAISTAEDVGRRIAAECAYVDDRAGGRSSAIASASL